MNIKGVLLTAILAVAGIFGVSSALINKQVNENLETEKAEASSNASLYSDKIYVELQNTYGLTNSKGVYLHFWGDGVSTIDVKGRSYDGSGGTTGYTWYFLFDPAYRGKKCQFWVDWTGVGNNDWAHNNCDVPSNDSDWRWIYVWKDNLWMSNNQRSFYRATTVDYDSNTTVEVSGDFTGIQNEYNKTEMVFTVSNPTNDGKVAALGQWNSSSCSGDPHTTHVLTNNQKTYAQYAYRFTSTQYFKPVLYNTLQYSLNGGSTWVDLACDDPTANTRVYSASSVSMTAGNQIKFRYNGSEVNPTLSYGSNFYTSGGNKYVKETGTGNISITYSSSTYSGSFGALATKPYGYYVLNYTTGDLYPTTSKANGYGTSILYLNNSDVIRFMYSSGSANDYYSISSVNSYSTSGVYSLGGGNVTIVGSDYYYLEMQNPGSGYVRLYIECYGVTITYNLNGHGDSTTERVERNQTFSAPSDPSSTGYTFAGWYKEAACTNAWNFASDTPDADKTLYAKWTPNTNTPYKVKHYKQNLDGTYPSTPTDTDNLTGTTGASVTPARKSYTGFTAPAGQTVTILADGSRVVTYQYTRNSYTLTWADNDGTVTGGTSGSVKYGATITQPSAVEREGYTFTGWNTTPASTMPAANTTYTAQWSVNSYNLTLTISTGIGTIYYKINDAENYSSTTSTITVSVEYGTTYYLYATKTNNGYILDDPYDDYTSSNPYSDTMGASAEAWAPTATSGETAAITYATSFNSSIGGVCVYAGGTDVGELKKAWGIQNTAYTPLADHVKYWLNKDHLSSNTNVTNMMAKYDYVYGKYGSDIGSDFLGREPSPLSAIHPIGLSTLFGDNEGGLSTVIIIVSSSVALLSITALSILVIKKRKNKEE